MNRKITRRRIMFSTFLLLITFTLLFITCKEKTVNTKTEGFNLKEEVANINMFDKIAINFTHHKKLKNITLIDIDKKKFLLKELIECKPKLVLKFSETNCSFCIEHSLKYIEKYENTIGTDNIIIIAHFININSFIAFKHLNPQIQSKIYVTKENDFTLTIDKLEKPYLFIVDTSLLPSKAIIPLKELPKRTDNYFKLLIKEMK